MARKKTADPMLDVPIPEDKTGTGMEGMEYGMENKDQMGMEGETPPVSEDPMAALMAEIQALKSEIQAMKAGKEVSSEPEETGETGEMESGRDEIAEAVISEIGAELDAFMAGEGDGNLSDIIARGISAGVKASSPKEASLFDDADLNKRMDELLANNPFWSDLSEAKQNEFIKAAVEAIGPDWSESADGIYGAQEHAIGMARKHLGGMFGAGDAVGTAEKIAEKVSDMAASAPDAVIVKATVKGKQPPMVGGRSAGSVKKPIEEMTDEEVRKIWDK